MCHKLLFAFFSFFFVFVLVCFQFLLRHMLWPGFCFVCKNVFFLPFFFATLSAVNLALKRKRQRKKHLSALAKATWWRGSLWCSLASVSHSKGFRFNCSSSKTQSYALSSSLPGKLDRTVPLMRTKNPCQTHMLLVDHNGDDNLYSTNISTLQQCAHCTSAATIIKLIIFVAYGSCWVCLCCRNPPNSDMNYRIFTVRTDANAWDCTWGCMDTEREYALDVDSGKKIPCHAGEMNLR